MKKIIAITLAAVLAAGAFSGCTPAGGSSSSSSSSSTATSSTVAKTKLEQIKEKGKLVMVTSPDYAPYEFVDLTKVGQGQEQYVGADVQVGKYIAEKLGVKLEIQAMDYDSVLTAITQGKCDIAISGISPTAERLGTMDFSVAIGSEGFQGVLIKKENADKFSSIESFNKPEIKLAVQNGSLQQTGATANFPKATQVIITKLGDGVMELQSGKVDGLVTASGVANGFIKSYPTLAMAGFELQFGEMGTAVAMTKSEDKSLKIAVDEIITQMEKDGLYLKWVEDFKVIAEAQAPKE